jgi:hypothetical protein
MERETYELRIDAIQTRWSLVRNAHAPGAAHSAEDARRFLVMRYIPAIRRYVGAIVKDAAGNSIRTQRPMNWRKD